MEAPLVRLTYQMFGLNAEMVSPIMKKKITLMACSALVTQTLLCPGHQAAASGFALRETDAISLGNAYVGSVSRANDASTALLNPAGMSFLESSEMESNVFYAGPVARFSGQNYVGPGTTTAGVQGNRGITDAATAASYGVLKIDPHWAIGYGFYTPYGQRANYPSNWVGRYQSLVSSITDYELGAMASYRFNKHFSIGVGPRMGFLTGRFTRDLNLGALNAFGPTTADLAGNAFGFGYDAGILYKPDEATQIGINYQSRITYDLSTRTKFAPPTLLAANPLINGSLIAQSGHGAMQVTLPDSVSFGITRVLSPRWTIMLQGEWTHWSLLHSLNNISDHVNGADTTIPVNWRNTWFGGIAATYRVSKAVLVRGGFSYDQSPTTLRNRNTITPDTNRFDLGTGIDYTPIKRLTLTLSYAHIFGTNPKINNAASATSGQLVGSYNDYGNIVAFGARMRF